MELDQFGAAGCAINIGESVPLGTGFEERVALALSAACTLALGTFATTLAEDEAMLMSDRATLNSDGEAVDGGDGGSAGGRSALGNRLRQCLHARASRKRCIAQLRDKSDAFAARPTAMATLRRPWHANIRTSG